jgi:hypothetical protein
MGHTRRIFSWFAVIRPLIYRGLYSSRRPGKLGEVPWCGGSVGILPSLVMKHACGHCGYLGGL